MHYRGHLQLWAMVIGTLFMSASLCAQQRYTRAQLDSMAFPKEIATTERWLTFDSLQAHLGVLSEEDKPVYRHFTFTNTGKESLRITRVRTSCGCTVAAYDTTLIASGKSGKVVLCYAPFNQAGIIDVDAFVYTTHSGAHPEVRLSLYGEVTCSDVWSHLPHQMGDLRLKRTTLHFTEVKQGSHPSLRIACANAGQKPLTLSSVLHPAYVTFTTEPKVIQPGEEGDLVVSIDSRRLPADSPTLTFTILVEGIKGKPSERSLRVTVDPIEQ